MKTKLRKKKRKKKVAQDGEREKEELQDIRLNCIKTHE
jgi:hypothetical protein